MRYSSAFSIMKSIVPLLSMIGQGSRATAALHPFSACTAGKAVELDRDRINIPPKVYGVALQRDKNVMHVSVHAHISSFFNIIIH